MYAIALHPFGYQLVFAEPFGKSETVAWLNDVERRLALAPASFGMILDLRDLAPLPPEARSVLAKGMQLFQDRGLLRCAVIVLTRNLQRQFTWLARQSGVYRWERYLSAEGTPDWHERATSWIVDGADPDL
jgi:hypothetical protein